MCRLPGQQLTIRVPSIRRLHLSTSLACTLTSQHHTISVSPHSRSQHTRREAALLRRRSRTCIKAENVQTAVIVFNDWSSQEISLYDEGESVEVEWTVGPIPINDGVGKEIILRYDTDIASQSLYYTDANGREVLERKRDFRPTWNYTVVETVSGNYYPVNSRIWIKDATRQLTLLTGSSSLASSLVVC